MLGRLSRSLRTCCAGGRSSSERDIAPSSAATCSDDLLQPAPHLQHTVCYHCAAPLHRGHFCEPGQSCTYFYKTACFEPWSGLMPKVCTPPDCMAPKPQKLRSRCSARSFWCLQTASRSSAYPVACKCCFLPCVWGSHQLSGACASCRADDIAWDMVKAEAATGKVYMHDHKDRLGRPVIVVKVAKHITGEQAAQRGCLSAGTCCEACICSATAHKQAWLQRHSHQGSCMHSHGKHRAHRTAACDRDGSPLFAKTPGARCPVWFSTLRANRKTVPGD